MSKEEIGLVSVLMDYDNCPDTAVDDAATLIRLLVEMKEASTSEWDEWLANREWEWSLEVEAILEKYN